MALKVAIIAENEDTGEIKVLIEHDLYHEARALGRLKGRKKTLRFLEAQETKIKNRTVELT